LARLRAGLVVSGGNDMKKENKEQVVAELTDRLKASDVLLVADYRGLTMPQIDELRSKLLESGARFSVVKNTLTRRAAEAAGADALLALLEGPSAIAFLEADGDMVAAAKALADMARDSKILAIRGGVMQGRSLTAEEVESLATLPPIDVLRGQVLGAIVAPLTAFLGLVSAPLQSLHGLIDARIEQLGAAEAEAAPAAEEPEAAEPEAAPAAEESVAAEETPAEEAPAEPTEADATASADPEPEPETPAEPETTEENE
jgi:large subunit ribosomal protein L10